MEIWQVLLDVVILLGAGALLGALFERFRQSAIVGYLVAGVLLGPNALHLVRSGEAVLALSELGVALLLFVIGLEFSWARLRTMGRTALGSGALQVVATSALGFGVALLFGFDVAPAIALGAISALSSTACVLRVLTARGEMESTHGVRALGILLVQDVAVVPLVLLVSVLSQGGTAGEVAASLLRTSGIGLALIGALYVVFNHLVPRLLASGPVHSNRELPLLVAVASGMGAAVVSHVVGLSPALGAFVAGILLAESPFAVQVRAEISSLKTLLLTLFFTAMGMLADVAWIGSHLLLVGAVVAALVLGKALVVWAALRVFRAPGRTALAAGICLGQVGEFSFVLAEIARGSILSDDDFMLIVSATVITMILTPYLVGHAPRLATRLMRRASHPGPQHDDDDADFGIVVGFGPAGRVAAERIAELGCGITVVDQNPTAAYEARRLGYRVIIGDARYGDVLDHAGLRRAVFVVVTVPDPEGSLHIVRFVRQDAPDTPVLVRSRFNRSLHALVAAGAHVAIDEEHEVGLRIAEAYETLVHRPKEEAE